MRSKEQTEKEKNVGTVIREQDETSGKQEIDKQWQEKKIEGVSYKQRQKKLVKIVQIMEKRVMHVTQVNI